MGGSRRGRSLLGQGHDLHGRTQRRRRPERTPPRQWTARLLLLGIPARLVRPRGGAKPPERHPYLDLELRDSSPVSAPLVGEARLSLKSTEDDLSWPHVTSWVNNPEVVLALVGRTVLTEARNFCPNFCPSEMTCPISHDLRRPNCAGYGRRPRKQRLITRRSQVQILPPLLEKPRKRGFSVLIMQSAGETFAQLLPSRRRRVPSGA